MKLRKAEKIILSLSIFVFLLIIIIGITYAIFTYDTEQEEENVYTAACYNIKFDEGSEGIEVENDSPKEDSDGLEQKPYTLTMTNNCQRPISFNLIFNVLEDSTTPDELMKISVNDKIQNFQNLDTYELLENQENFQKSYRVSGGNLKSGEKATYEFRTWMDINSTEGEETEFKGKISVEFPQSTNKILANNELKSSEGLDFSTGSPYCEFDVASWKCIGDYISNGDGLYEAPDDDGTSYYFRGDKTLINNNVTFAGKKWYIIRINGDGTIRLILNGRIEDQETKVFAFNEYLSTETLQHKLVGFTYDNATGKECIKEHPCVVTYDKEKNEFSNANFGGTNVNIKNVLEGWYQENLNGYDDNIAYGSFCNDISYGGGVDDYSRNYLTYGGNQRLFSQAFSGKASPTLICPEQVDNKGNPRPYGGLYKTKIGLITADELNMGGFRTTAEYYSEKTYLKLGNFHYYTITPVGSNYNAGIFSGHERAYLMGINTNIKHAVVPVINLKPDVKFTTTGTDIPGSSTNPYIVE